MIEVCKRYIPLITICVFSIVFGWFAYSSLYDGHNWGDDFGAYLQLAKNIVIGRDYLYNYSGVNAPPGFPTLLALWMYLFGDGFITLKIINIFSWISAAFLLFYTAKKLLGNFAAVFSALLFFSVPYYFFAQQNIITDIPFVLICNALFLAVIASWYEQETAGAKQKTVGVLLIGLIIFIAFMFRPAALGLAAGLLVACIVTWIINALKSKSRLLWLKKNYPSTGHVGMVGLTVFIVIAINFSFFADASGDHLHNMADSSGVQAYQKLINNIPFRASEELANFYILFFGYPYSYLFSVILFAFTVLGLCVYIAKIKDFFIPIITITYIFMLLLTPWQNGPRYLMPIIVPCILFWAALVAAIYNFIFYRISKIVAVLTLAAVLFWLFIIIFSSVLDASKFNDEEILKPNAQSVFDWIKTNTKKDDRICSFKPRAIMYLTDRPFCVVSPISIPIPFGPTIVNQKGSYAVLTRQESYPDMRLATLKLLGDPTVKIVFKNKDYVIYQPVIENFSQPTIPVTEDKDGVFTDKIHVQITVTGRKNKLAGAAEVWLFGFYSNIGDKIKGDLVLGGFQNKNDAILGLPAADLQQPSLVWDSVSDDKYFILFRTHDHSGIVNVKFNNDLSRDIDLFSIQEGILKIPLRSGL